MPSARSAASDLFTPFFLPWRARLSALRRSLPNASSSTPILHQLEILFGSLIPHHALSPTDEGSGSRQRVWPIRVTFWTFLAQVLSPRSSCRCAVRQAQTQAQMDGRPVPEDDTGAYCTARKRLPLESLHQSIRKVAEVLEQRVPAESSWCGRAVKILDATTFTAEDTPQNQDRFPQTKRQKAGCGFPLVRLTGLFSLSSGAVLGFATGDYQESELALAMHIWELLDPGDVLLADRGFGSYRVLASVLARQADAVCRLHASRKADFRCGKRKGALDRQMVWTRPDKVPPGMTRSQWLELPATITVRVVRFRVMEKGYRTHEVTLVTTLLDVEKYPVSALAALYRRRGQVELSFHQIKIALGMDHLAVRSPEMIERSLAMHLLAYQLIRSLMQEAALTWDVPLERISFKGSLDSSHHFADALLRATTRKARLKLMAELLRVLAADAVPERPGRHEPRAVKRRPKPFPKLNCPRRLFRDVPHINRILAARAKARRNRGVK